MNGDTPGPRRDGDDYTWKWHAAVVGILLALIVVAWFALQPLIQAR